MEKKYEMFKEKETDVLYRIRALRDFGCVKKGDIGGYIKKEENLSHEGDCWVFGNALVYDNARVYDNVCVCGEARVYDNACVCGEARVYDNACVYGNARVYDNACVYGNALIKDYAHVYGKAQVYGNAYVYNNVCVYSNAIICQTMSVCYSLVKDDLRKNIKMSLRCQCNLPVEDDYVIAYKLVNKNLSSFYDEDFFYRVGEIIEEENSEISDKSCVSGLHFSNLTYWDNSAYDYFNNLYIKAKIKLEDIITVQEGKIRCRKAEILSAFEP